MKSLPIGLAWATGTDWLRVTWSCWKAAAALEESMLGQHQDLVTALQAAGVNAERRSLRLLPAGLEWHFDGDNLVLGFALPPGAYATSLLRELVLTKAASISESK
jgi:tRNA pseudouridine13 synthase